MNAQSSENLGRFGGDHTSENILTRLDTAIGAVRDRGVRVDVNTRVVRWRKVLQEFAAADRRSILEQMLPGLRARSWQHPYRDAFRALVDARLFLEIVEQFLPDLAPSDLRDLVSGNFHPEHDQASSRARDREFELFVAAVCRRSGLPTTLGEPDVVVEYEGAAVSLAAKRLSSPKRIVANLRRAEEQITTASRPGLVVADVTRILDPDYVVVTHWRHAPHTVEGPLQHVIATYVSATLSTRQNPLVLGAVLRVALPLVSEGFRYGTYETWSVVRLEGGNADWLKRFGRQFGAGGQGT